MKKFIVISFLMATVPSFATRTRDPLSEQQAQQTNNIMYLNFLQRSCNRISNGLYDLQQSPNNVTDKRIAQLRSIINNAITILFIDNSFSFLNPTESQQIQCVALREQLESYDMQLQPYETKDLP